MSCFHDDLETKRPNNQVEESSRILQHTACESPAGDVLQEELTYPHMGNHRHQ